MYLRSAPVASQALSIAHSPLRRLSTVDHLSSSATVLGPPLSPRDPHHHHQASRSITRSETRRGGLQEGSQQRQLAPHQSASLSPHGRSSGHYLSYIRVERVSHGINQHLKHQHTASSLPLLPSPPSSTSLIDSWITKRTARKDIGRLPRPFPSTLSSADHSLLRYRPLHKLCYPLSPVDPPCFALHTYITLRLALLFTFFPTTPPWRSRPAPSRPRPT